MTQQFTRHKHIDWALPIFNARHGRPLDYVSHPAYATYNNFTYLTEVEVEQCLRECHHFLGGGLQNYFLSVLGVRTTVMRKPKGNTSVASCDVHRLPRYPPPPPSAPAVTGRKVLCDVCTCAQSRLHLGVSCVLGGQGRPQAAAPRSPARGAL
jgi:hypothetical protein